MQLEGIDHVAMSVADIERSAKWYADVLGFDRRFPNQWDGVPAFIGLGSTAIALFPARPTAASISSIPETIRMLHLAFRADQKSFYAAQEELKQRKITFTFEDHQIAHSIYFRDPDGHKLEITTYEI
jgi:catechol 2,3-dioxygenase-like lactoylglutathione lyase family enzyme